VKGDRMGVRSPQLNTTNYKDKTMTEIHNSADKARVFPWIIVRLLPNLQRIAVGRFRHRSSRGGTLAGVEAGDADGRFCDMPEARTRGSI